MGESAIEHLIEAPPIIAVMAREWWDYDDCAIFLKVERNTVKNKYSRLESWPPRRGGGELGKPMYRASEVKAWLKSESEDKISLIIKSNEGKSFLYAMSQNNGLTKIGISNNPQERRKKIQYGSGFPTEIVKLFAVDPRLARGLEKHIHAQFAHLRSVGEWFNDFPLFHLDTYVSDYVKESNID